MQLWEAKAKPLRELQFLAHVDENSARGDSEAEVGELFTSKCTEKSSHRWEREAIFHGVESGETIDIRTNDEWICPSDRVVTFHTAEVEAAT